ncbi:peptidylprolyl isomerase [Phenylobacterium montanum]|uniref:peptidylprolyl isomerase n=1 Tax=Phenylobacterium montanum TaxID=2823693 RepID=A0A975FY34_9CAUL|nr:peptidylprolyl isomerase [Caulobacter sp. S6]QUD86411.1 peptidylprolyl isomerase [Caulobacter sp. S6]
MRRWAMQAGLCLALCAGAASAAPAPTWRGLDPDNTLVIDTSQGRIVVEMRPEFAPQSVARVKLLAREGVYDGLLFHRVIDRFVDQTGNPNNRDGGTSSHPNLPPEFDFLLKPDAADAIASRASDGITGFVGATPFSASQLPRPDGTLRAAGAYCAGVVGMGREEDPGTGNSEIFFMREPSRRLDRSYSVWGRVVQGLDVVRTVAIGEPPAHPDRMIKVRVMADLPATERPKLEVMNPRSAAFAALIRKVRAAKGADFSICDIDVPSRSQP